MRVGVDVDGVLADFNRAFITRVIQVTGRNLFPAGYEPTTWGYPTEVGYTLEEEAAVWETITEDRCFWSSLTPYPETRAAVEYLHHRAYTHRDDVYFITARPGLDAKKQTEAWLRAQFGHVSGFLSNPTVLITKHKGLAARTLDLDVYIDDRYENAIDVGMVHTDPSIPLRGRPSTVSFLLDRPWNAGLPNSPAFVRTFSVEGICEVADAIARGTARGTTPRSHASEVTPA